MFQNVLLFIHLKMFKIGCILNIIYCNKPCLAWCSVWHRTTTVHLVILMWITFCKSFWVFAVNCMINTITAQWCELVVMCNVQHIVTNHTESQIFPFTGGWLHMSSFKKCITHSHPVNFIFWYHCPLFLHTFWHWYICTISNCIPLVAEANGRQTGRLLLFSKLYVLN